MKDRTGDRERFRLEPRVQPAKLIKFQLAFQGLRSIIGSLKSYVICLAYSESWLGRIAGQISDFRGHAKIEGKMSCSPRDYSSPEQTCFS